MQWTINRSPVATFLILKVWFFFGGMIQSREQWFFQLGCDTPPSRKWIAFFQLYNNTKEGLFKKNSLLSSFEGFFFQEDSCMWAVNKNCAWWYRFILFVIVIIANWVLGKEFWAPAFFFFAFVHGSRWCGGCQDPGNSVGRSIHFNLHNFHWFSSALADHDHHDHDHHLEHHF